MENIVEGRGKGKGIEVSFSGPNLTIYGGMGLLSKFVTKLKVKEVVEEKVQLPRRERKYSSGDMVLSLVYAQSVDLERLSDTGALRQDRVFHQVAEIDDYPHQTSLSRFLRKFTVAACSIRTSVSYPSDR